MSILYTYSIPQHSITGTLIPLSQSLPQAPMYSHSHIPSPPSPPSAHAHTHTSHTFAHSPTKLHFPNTSPQSCTFPTLRHKPALPQHSATKLHSPHTPPQSCTPTLRHKAALPPHSATKLHSHTLPQSCTPPTLCHKAALFLYVEHTTPNETGLIPWSARCCCADKCGNSPLIYQCVNAWRVSQQQISRSITRAFKW